MSNVNYGPDQDEFYFEDDREYEGYPGCSSSSPPLLDPISLLNPDRLTGGYDGTWTRYDSLRIESQPDEKYPGVAFINDRRVPIHRRTDLYEYAYGLTSLPSSRRWLLPFLSERCPYCKHDLSIHQVADGRSKWDGEDDEDFFDEEMDESAEVQALEYCHNCRYWRWHDFGVFTSFTGVSHTYRGALSKLREFDNVLPEGFTQEVAQWMRVHRQSWHTIHPTSLEKLVAEVIGSVYRPAEAVHVGGPGDGGVDVVFVDADKRKWLIQVKRRGNPTRGEPVSTVRNLLGAMYTDSSYGMIVSTADHFTYSAYERASRAGEKGGVVKLVDRGKLDRMLDSVLPDKPWLELLNRDYPTIASDFEAAMGTPEIDPDPLGLR